MKSGKKDTIGALQQMMRVHIQIIKMKGVDKEAAEKSSFVGAVRRLLTKEEPTLTPEELEEAGEASWIEKIRKLELKGDFEKNKVRRKEILEKELPSLYEKIGKKIREIRAAKNKLLKELEEKITQGNTLLGSATNKETIKKFLIELNNFLLLEEKPTHEVEAEVS